MKTRTIWSVVFHVNVSHPVPAFSSDCLYPVVTFSRTLPNGPSSMPRKRKEPVENTVVRADENEN